MLSLEHYQSEIFGVFYSSPIINEIFQSNYVLSGTIPSNPFG